MMAETKQFKTKLCLMYEKGHCERQSCTFAHGNCELRHLHHSERRINRGDDLRNKLDRKRSPETRYSSGRDTKDSQNFTRFTPPPPHKRRKYRTHSDLDNQNDFQRTVRSQEGTPERRKDKMSVASGFKIGLPDELKQVQYDVEMLLNQKSQLKIELEERIQEADSLSSRIRDLEAQLSEEKDKFKSVKSKIKTFIVAHVHHSRLQDQMKRSQLQLEQLVEEISIDATQIDANDLNVNVISDEDIPRSTPRKRPLPSTTEAPQVYKSGNVGRGHGVSVDASVKSSHAHLDANREAELDTKREDNGRWSSESKSRHRKHASKSYGSSDKVVESHLVAAPPTSMAAHAVDDFDELTEADENLEDIATTNQSVNAYPFLPLPTITQNNYSEHEGDDENVSVDGLDADADAEC